MCLKLIWACDSGIDIFLIISLLTIWTKTLVLSVLVLMFLDYKRSDRSIGFTKKSFPSVIKGLDKTAGTKVPSCSKQIMSLIFWEIIFRFKKKKKNFSKRGLEKSYWKKLPHIAFNSIFMVFFFYVLVNTNTFPVYHLCYN